MRSGSFRITAVPYRRLSRFLVYSTGRGHFHTVLQRIRYGAQPYFIYARLTIPHHFPSQSRSGTGTLTAI